MYVVQEPSAAIPMDVEPVDYTMQLHPENDKCTNLRNILRRMTPESKFLIFSAHETVFIQITDILHEMDITFEILKGNQYVINHCVECYKNGKNQVLLVNPRNYGSGLNLENTTDIILFHKFDTEIEHQVIGRAQRIGRKAPLRVWYLVHENEMQNAQPSPHVIIHNGD